MQFYKETPAKLSVDDCLKKLRYLGSVISGFIYYSFAYSCRINAMFVGLTLIYRIGKGLGWGPPKNSYMFNL